MDYSGADALNSPTAVAAAQPADADAAAGTASAGAFGDSYSEAAALKIKRVGDMAPPATGVGSTFAVVEAGATSAQAIAANSCSNNSKNTTDTIDSSSSSSGTSTGGAVVGAGHDEARISSAAHTAVSVASLKKGSRGRYFGAQSGDSIRCYRCVCVRVSV